MGMLLNQATEDRTQSTLGTFDYELPNTEPTENGAGTGAAELTFARWKAKFYTATTTLKNTLYDVAAMRKYRKILKRYSKTGTTAMSA